MLDVAVLGGGASGLCAAIAAAAEGASVTVFEAAERVGAKILATGNGRCNLTNTGLSAADYNHPSFVEPVLRRWGPQELLAWFEAQGLLTLPEREGRVYPLSNSANSVLDVLRSSCQRAGVAVQTNARAERVVPLGQGRGFELEFKDGACVKARRVVVAACADGARLLGFCGHGSMSPQPVLGALATQTGPIRGLSGVRVKCRLSLRAAQDGSELFSQEGELLFRDYGISGIVVFNASRFAQPGCIAVIDLMPGSSEGEFLRLLVGRAQWAASYEELMQGIFHSQVNRAMMRTAGCKPGAPVQEEGLRALAAVAKGFRLHVVGPGDPKHAQVTRGGAELSGFDPTVLESLLQPGLYACGECLDVDGPCGGYNLHWAWASGLIAGQAAARGCADF
ncbi:MAG: aminoacetone oxidase family FAD-binding enzyme [Coriobacteriales bacterium]